MIAIINDSNANIEEILEDINNQLFNCISPKIVAHGLYNQLEEAIENGATEEYIYREMTALIKEFS